MIQALRHGKTTWLLYWLELGEPVPGPEGYVLPTILILGDAKGIPLAPPEISEELQQEKAEQLVQTVMERHGPPDRIIIGSSQDWDQEAWKSFAKEFRTEVRFQKLDQRGVIQLVQVAKALSDRSGEKEEAERTPTQIAQDLLTSFQKLRSPRRRKAYLQKALELDPDNAAARVELADILLSEGGLKAAQEAYARASAMTQLPPGQALDWESQRGRILLRALYGSAMCHWHQGRHEPAAILFTQLTQLCPVDPQGARFFIPLLYLLAEDIERALLAYQEYEKSYPDDFQDPAFLFGWALSLHHQGDEAQAKQRYQTAMLKNFYIAPLLLDETPPPSRLWQPTDRCEIAYAEEFIDSYAVLWDREAGSLRLVREAWTELGERVQKLVEHRNKMHEFQDQRYDPDYKKKWREMIDLDERLSGNG